MGSFLIDGKAIASRVRGEVGERVKHLADRWRAPHLAVVLVGDNPASATYVSSKDRAAREVGITATTHRLPASASEPEVLGLVRRLGQDGEVDGILVQLPLPAGVDAERVLEAIPPHKDVDGLHPTNVGLLAAGRPALVPCTPAGVVRLLKESGVVLAGARAVVLGRSQLVGKPMAQLLLAENATVTVCHSRTRDEHLEVRRAEVLVSAVGKPELVRGDWIAEGAVVIDVGINRRPSDGKLCGDVCFDEAAQRARLITPVPGGVGPMTIAQLLWNTVQAAERRLETGGRG
jgi:methylenetetrahydrofolate dehydrogenase (NADP+)/methenyltetrahydrofolate cyclohydrolase